MRSQARKITDEAELSKKITQQDAELNHETQLADVDINRAKQMAEIESKKFEELVSSIGTETLVAMANVRLLYRQSMFNLLYRLDLNCKPSY